MVYLQGRITAHIVIRVGEYNAVNGPQDKQEVKYFLPGPRVDWFAISKNHCPK